MKVFAKWIALAVFFLSANLFAGTKLAVITSFNCEGADAQKKKMEKELDWLKAYCSNFECSIERVSFEDASSGKVDLKEFDCVAMFLYTSYPAEFWQVLKKYYSNGGNILWSGNWGRFAGMDKLSKQKMGPLFGVKIEGYQSDPNLGSSPPKILMWVRLVQDCAMVPRDIKPLCAVFSGEGLKLQTQGDGVAAGYWANRDRTTEEGGPAIVITSNNKNGKSVFIGFHILALAAQVPDSLPKTSSQEILRLAFKWFGVFK